MSADRYLTQTEVCARLRISRKTLQRYRHEGRISSRNFGHRSIRIRESELQAFLWPGALSTGNVGTLADQKGEGPQKHPSDSILVEIIPEDELPIDCAAPVERCLGIACVRVTSSSGYERRPVCLGHAHVIFSEWAVGI